MTRARNCSVLGAGNLRAVPPPGQGGRSAGVEPQGARALPRGKGGTLPSPLQPPSLPTVLPAPHPERSQVKQRLRDVIAPDKGLGHSDSPSRVSEAVRSRWPGASCATPHWGLLPICVRILPWPIGKSLMWKPNLRQMFAEDRAGKTGGAGGAGGSEQSGAEGSGIGRGETAADSSTDDDEDDEDGEGAAELRRCVQRTQPGARRCYRSGLGLLRMTSLIVTKCLISKSGEMVRAGITASSECSSECAADDVQERRTLHHRQSPLLPQLPPTNTSEHTFRNHTRTRSSRGPRARQRWTGVIPSTPERQRGHFRASGGHAKSLVAHPLHPGARHRRSQVRDPAHAERMRSSKCSDRGPRAAGCPRFEIGVRGGGSGARPAQTRVGARRHARVDPRVEANTALVPAAGAGGSFAGRRRATPPRAVAAALGVLELELQRAAERAAMPARLGPRQRPAQRPAAGLDGRKQQRPRAPRRGAFAGICLVEPFALPVPEKARREARVARGRRLSGGRRAGSGRRPLALAGHPAQEVAARRAISTEERRGRRHRRRRVRRRRRRHRSEPGRSTVGARRAGTVREGGRAPGRVGAAGRRGGRGSDWRWRCENAEMRRRLRRAPRRQPCRARGPEA